MQSCAGLLAGLLLAVSAMAGETLEIAPPSEALTFARTVEGGMPTRLLLVTAYEDGKVTGIDLSRALGRPVFDPVILYARLGRRAILEALDVIPASAAVTVDARALGLPVGLAGRHIAVGANFPAHAEEATVDDGPFIFVKDVHPTGPYAPIPAGDGLLDYEAELCFVPMRDFPAVRPTAEMGLVLCNDVTDRATLLRKLDAFDIASGRGFAEGKSAPGYLPVGNLFVIPADVRAFAAALTLRLWVNGALRQEAPVYRAIWDTDEILRQAENRKGQAWPYGEGTIMLPFRQGRVPARTLILSGTPSGTVFDGVRFMHRFRGALDWLTGGWDRPVQQWVADRYIREQRQLRRYLGPGDVVTIQVDRMGLLQNPVVP
jgi:2-keto-4-pentenoate hydratase/2-oxohepta-3-ene-1,7-dioic acid hydratase in catechol pathway